MTIKCRRCGMANVSISEVRNYHGHCIAVVCDVCRGEINAKLERLRGSGVIAGRRVSSPFHTADVRSEQELNEALEAQSQEPNATNRQSPY